MILADEPAGYTDEMIVDSFLIVGCAEEVAMDMIDHGVSRGEVEIPDGDYPEYDGYVARVKRVIDEAGG